MKVVRDLQIKETRTLVFFFRFGGGTTNRCTTDLFTSLFTSYLQDDGDDDLDDGDERRSWKVPLPPHFRLDPHSAMDQPGQNQHRLMITHSRIFPHVLLKHSSPSGTELSGGR